MHLKELLVDVCGHAVYKDVILRTSAIKQSQDEL